jgi:hypothetical protein
MHDHLSAKNLLAHIEHLSKHIGPRPTGSPQEEQAHAYIRRILTANDVSNIEEQVFFTPSTAAISFGIPLGMYVISNLFGWWKSVGSILGGFMPWSAPIRCGDNFTDNRHSSD